MEQNDKRKKVILDLMGEEFYIPMKEKELAVMLQVSKESVLLSAIQRALAL